MADLLSIYHEQCEKIQAAAPGVSVNGLSIIGSWPPAFSLEAPGDKEMLLTVATDDVERSALAEVYESSPDGELSERLGNVTVKVIATTV